MVIAAAALCALGLALLVVGLRGRRIDDHPLCRACRFDLIGLRPAESAPSAPARCPECGADVSRLGSTRRGHRRRFRSALVAASILLLVGLGLGAAGVWAAASGFNLNTLKPAWWLKAEADSTHVPTAAAAIAELTDRLATGKLASADVDLLIARALERQADQDRAWVGEWASLADAAWKQDLLTTEQLTAFARNAVRLDVSVRRRGVRGEPCAVRLNVTAPRLGPTRRLMLRPSVRSVEIAGASLVPPPVDARLGVTEGGSSSVFSSFTLDAPPGDHTLRTTWLIEARTGFNLEDPVVATWTFTGESPVTVLPEGSEVIRLVKGDAIATAMRAAVKAEAIRIGADLRTGERNVSFGMQFTDLPADIGFDVFIRTRGPEPREWPVGSLALKGGFKGQHGYGIGGPTPGLDGPPRPEAVDLVLRPSIEPARRTVDILDVWDGQIVIENVPLKWPEPPGK